MGRDLIPQPEFDAIVEEALASVPKPFLDLLRNIAVIVEDEPTDADLDDVGFDDDTELLGIFRGIALPDQGFDGAPMPGEIAIFRGPLTRVCDSRDELVQEIRDTVIHELGHYFGLDDHEMEY